MGRSCNPTFSDATQRGLLVPGVAAQLVNLGGTARMRIIGMACGGVLQDEPVGGTVVLGLQDLLSL